jgi:hypothetical protein
MAFKFELNTKVNITRSGEQGNITARCESNDSINSYQVEYDDGNGCAQCRWFSEREISECDDGTTSS